MAEITNEELMRAIKNLESLMDIKLSNINLSIAQMQTDISKMRSDISEIKMFVATDNAHFPH